MSRHGADERAYFHCLNMASRLTNGEPNRFLFCALAWTTLFWSLPIITQFPVWEGANAIWIYLGGSGPLFVRLIFVWRAGRSQALRELGSRMVDPCRILWRWWLITLCLLQVLLIVSILIVGGPVPAGYCGVAQALLADLRIAGGGYARSAVHCLASWCPYSDIPGVGT